MKNFIIIIVVFLFTSIMYSQSTNYKCGTMEYLQKQLEEDPSLKNVMLMQEAQIKESIKELNESENDEVITIPVVFHIIYNKDEENIPDLRIYEQLEFLNRDYAGLKENSMGGFSDSLRANTGIQFCLAKRDQNGFATSGIERKYTSDTVFLGNYVKSSQNGGLDAWNPKKYLNIWVCNLRPGLAGYAQFPNEGLNNTFGAVIDYVCVGRTNASSIRNNGGTLSHELGHCFYLYHIWGDDKGSCSGTDYCEDTPNQAAPTYGNPKETITDLCTTEFPGIMFMNFMDYTWDSTNTCFTPDQSKRIRAMFIPPYGPLTPLISSDGCVPPVSNITDDVKTSVSVFPNPANELININYSLNSSAVVSISIINSFGKEVINLKSNKVYEIGSQNLTIDIGGLVSGIYYYVINTKSVCKGNREETYRGNFVVVK